MAKLDTLTTNQAILVLAANPASKTRLRLNMEIREIDQGLRRTRHREHFRLEQRSAVRPEDLRRSLLDMDPQIVHLFGHATREEGLVFEDQISQSILDSTKALADFFELFAGKSECVFLNACYSEVQADAIARHIVYVIWMKQSIGDRAAIQFTTGFYNALEAGRFVAEAYCLGCSAIQLEGLQEHLTPVLKKHKLQGFEKRVVWNLVLTAKLQDLNWKRTEEIIELLCKITGDVLMTLKSIAEGSVIINLEIFEDGFERTQSIISSGNFTYVQGIPIQKKQLT